ncbi:unnamed protein product [Soboliphyme baturini]|uniref:Splicing factor Cactin n=1 Tax=Soboliphyme baturini TaxID=241478 RepID=A0A183ICN1_9BILA|nr:unnamed protein product [Soboliphyme baturini]
MTSGAGKMVDDAESRRKQKILMKLLETPEEKRARRLAKKLAKEQRRKQELGWGEECLGYSNADNPFGDSNLTQPFSWQKKLVKDGLADLDARKICSISREKLEKNKRELEKIRQMRQEREAQKAEWEMMQRDRENQQFVEWSKQEDRFHLEQARLRSQIRIQEGRAKPIDLLARYINQDDEEYDNLDFEMHEPYTYLVSFEIRDYEDLLEDIKIYRALEGDKNDEFWSDITVIAEDELKRQKNAASSDVMFMEDRREGIHATVRDDISIILKGKSREQLNLLERQIMRKIRCGEEGIDVGYWETLLGQLKAHMARARLRERHQAMLRKKLERLKQEQFASDGTSAPVEDEASAESSTCPAYDMPVQPSADIPVQKESSEVEKDGCSATSYMEDCYSPPYLKEEALPHGIEILDPLDDLHCLQFSREQQRLTGVATSQKDAVMEAEARKGMTSDELSFSIEAPLAQKTYLWSDKYRPRKPRYFNRVHTGFEWNKYNQTHYDLDNAPPKIVQGYVIFQIFYPDLLDSSKTPEFAVISCKRDIDFVVLKFHAGPPYEVGEDKCWCLIWLIISDIAFKIVNREWEVSHKKGYRCQFQNGIFQLWFHFKKYRYRR